MAIPKREKYSEEKIEKLKKYFRTFSDRGRPIDYEVVIDDFKVIPRTNDPSFFEELDDFINEDTKEIEVIFFTGTSNNNYKHIFTVGEEPKDQSLNGPEIEKRIQDQVNKARKEWDYEQLKKDCEEWKEYAEELEEDVEKLEKQLEELRSNQSPLHGFLGEFGSSFVSGLVKQNPKISEKIPGLSGLVENSGKEVSSETNAKPGFEPSKDEAEMQEAKEALGFVRYLKKKLNQEQFGKVMVILDTLTENPEKIESVSEFLK